MNIVYHAFIWKTHDMDENVWAFCFYNRTVLLRSGGQLFGNSLHPYPRQNVPQLVSLASRGWLEFGDLDRDLPGPPSGRQCPRYVSGNPNRPNRCPWWVDGAVVGSWWPWPGCGAPNKLGWVWRAGGAPGRPVMTPIIQAKNRFHLAFKATAWFKPV